MPSLWLWQRLGLLLLLLLLLPSHGLCGVSRVLLSVIDLTSGIGLCSGAWCVLGRLHFGSFGVSGARFWRLSESPVFPPGSPWTTPVPFRGALHLFPGHSVPLKSRPLVLECRLLPPPLVGFRFGFGFGFFPAGSITGSATGSGEPPLGVLCPLLQLLLLLKLLLLPPQLLPLLMPLLSLLCVQFSEPGGCSGEVFMARQLFLMLAWGGSEASFCTWCSV